MWSASELLFTIVDVVFLLKLGSAYHKRFERYAQEASSISKWRTEQQKEWNRLSMVLILLVTTNSAILAVPSAPRLAVSCWLGGAGLSICGLFILQYCAIQSTWIADRTMRELVRDHNTLTKTQILALALATPVIMALWAAIFFMVGIVDYAVEAQLGGALYWVCALVPMGLGVLAAVAIVGVGSSFEWHVRRRKSLNAQDCASDGADGKYDVAEQGMHRSEHEDPGEDDRGHHSMDTAETLAEKGIHLPHLQQSPAA